MSGTLPVAARSEQLFGGKTGAGANAPHGKSTAHPNHLKRAREAAAGLSDPHDTGKRIARRKNEATETKSDLDTHASQDFGLVFADAERTSTPSQISNDARATIGTDAPFPGGSQVSLASQEVSKDTELERHSPSSIRQALKFPVLSDQGDVLSNVEQNAGLPSNYSKEGSPNADTSGVMSRRDRGSELSHVLGRDVSAELPATQSRGGSKAVMQGDLSAIELAHRTGFEGRVEVTQVRNYWLFDAAKVDTSATVEQPLKQGKADARTLARVSGSETGIVSDWRTSDAAPIMKSRADNRSSSDANAGGRHDQAHRQSASGVAKPLISAARETIAATDAGSLSIFGSPAAQLSRNIIAELGEGTGQPDGAGGFLRTTTLAMPARLARSLELTLEPANLGKLQVKMNLAGKDLKIDIQATNPDTARYLTENRDVIDSALRDVGVDISSMTVTLARAEVAPVQVQASAETATQAGVTDGHRSALLHSGSDTGAGRGAQHEQRPPRSLVESGEGNSALSSLAEADRNALYV